MTHIVRTAWENYLGAEPDQKHQAQWAMELTIANLEKSLNDMQDRLQKQAQQIIFLEIDCGWQPIFTVPKDGTVVDLWGVHHGSFDKKEGRITNVTWHPAYASYNDPFFTKTNWNPSLPLDFEPIYWIEQKAPNNKSKIWAQINKRAK